MRSNVSVHVDTTAHFATCSVFLSHGNNCNKTYIRPACVCMSIRLHIFLVLRCVRLTVAVEPGQEVTVRCGRYIHHRQTTTTTVLPPPSSSSSSSAVSTASAAAVKTTARPTTLIADTTSTHLRLTDFNNAHPQTAPQTLSTSKSPRSLKTADKKSTWQRYYKSTSSSRSGDRNEHHPSISAKTRAKLHRLARKFSTVSDNTVNGINKPDYGDLIRYEASYQASRGSSSRKNQHDGVGYYTSNSTAVGDQNETVTKSAALNNVTYSETVYDNTKEMSFGDGQRLVFGVTEESTVGTKRQETPKTKTETNHGSVAAPVMTNENSTRMNITRTHRFEVDSNAIPTFPRVEPTARTVQKPEVLAVNSKVNKLNKVYRLAKEGGRRISKNERYSKVGREPPFWVPVEPIQVEPFLREPAEKDNTFEEPYEPIPPLAKYDIGYQNWKPDSKTEPGVTVPVNISQVTVGRRPEAKEGGASQLGKIASPLEQEWIHKAEVAAVDGDTSLNETGFQPNHSAAQPNELIRTESSEFTVNNHTEQKLQQEDDNVQSLEEILQVNHGENDCATTSWKNVQLVQDALGGFYVIQEKTRANCSEEKAAKPTVGQEHISINEDISLKPEKHDLTRSTTEQVHSTEPDQTDNTSPVKVGEADWMYFDVDGNLSKDVPHHPTKDPSQSKSESSKDFSRHLLNPTDITDRHIQLPGDSSAVSDFTDDLVRYYVIQQHPRLQKGQESGMKDDIASFTTDHLQDEEQTDLASNRKVVLASDRQNPDAVLWQRFPITGREGPWANAGDLVENGFKIADQSEMDLQHDDGSPKSTGKPSPNTEFPQRHTTPETVRAVVPAAFHLQNGRHTTSISGQSITWGKRYSINQSINRSIKNSRIQGSPNEKPVLMSIDVLMSR